MWSMLTASRMADNSRRARVGLNSRLSPAPSPRSPQRSRSISRLVLPFDHDAQQRLGAGVADEQASASPSRRSTSATDAATAGTVCQSGFALTRTFSSTCGNAFSREASSARDRPVAVMTWSTLSAVTRPSPVYRRSEKMTWPDCSPPSDRSSRDQLFHHVLVAHRAAHEPDARLAQRDLEADVAHDGGDDRPVLQPARGVQVAGSQQHDRVAVDDPPAFVGEDRAVAIAVERDAEPAAGLDHRARQAPRDASTRNPG